MKKYLVFLFLVSLVLVSCKNKKQSLINKDEYYTCSMHPQVMESKPGTCPICHMDLIVAKKNNTAADEILLNDEQVKLGNIQMDTIRNGMIGDKTVLTATLNADETKVSSINARIMGRIDRLYFKNTGDYVSKGAHLYDLYSEELNNAKLEYIATLERQQTLDNSLIDFNRLIQSARTKLLLWGMNDAQLKELEATHKSSALTEFYSTASGFITSLPVMEGQYVMEGSPVVKLADLSSLWAEAQVYASQLSSVDLNGTTTVQLQGLDKNEVTGKIEFVNPEINPDTRINLIRVSIPNNNHQLKPGMLAYILLKSRQRNSLTLPVDAVIRDSKSATVWVKTGPHLFKSKMVEVGLESDDRIEIKSGLSAGDIVVTSGAYLLQSEYIFKKGTNPMAGHDMSKM